MCSLENEINVVIVGFDIGLFDVNDIKNWASSVIGRGFDIEDSIYDIAFLSSSEKHRMKELLNNIRKNDITENVLQVLLGIIHHRIVRGNLSLELAMNIAYRITRQEYYSDLDMDNKELNDIIFITDEFDLIYIKGKQETKEKIIDRLSQYKFAYDSSKYKF